jgi:hypothetical protein
MYINSGIGVLLTAENIRKIGVIGVKEQPYEGFVVGN